MTPTDQLTRCISALRAIRQAGPAFPAYSLAEEALVDIGELVLEAAPKSTTELRAERDAQKAALDQLARLTEELGGYDPEFRALDERSAEKQVSRDEDARRLAAGEVTREELKGENSVFGSIAREARLILKPGSSDAETEAGLHKMTDQTKDEPDIEVIGGFFYESVEKRVDELAEQVRIDGNLIAELERKLGAVNASLVDSAWRDARIAELEKALRTALEGWREADYHWALEFGPVSDRWQEWNPDHPEFDAAINALADEKTSEG